MLLVWVIPFADDAKDRTGIRGRYLDTACLDPELRAEVEASINPDYHHGKHIIYDYRHLFSDVPPSIRNESMENQSYFPIWCEGYLEDENGDEHPRSYNRLWEPAAYEELRDKQQKCFIRDICLSEEQHLAFANFIRACNEMLRTGFLNASGDHISIKDELNTSFTETDMSHFVMIFRRLYMTKESGQFLQVAKMFVNEVPDYPFRERVVNLYKEYEAYLEYPIKRFWTLNIKNDIRTKKLIDVVIHSRFAHQPGKAMVKEHTKIKEAFDYKESGILAVFLNSLRVLSEFIIAGNNYISCFYEEYCQRHKIEPNTGFDFSRIKGLGSIRQDEKQEN